MQKKVLKDEVLPIAEEERKEEAEGLRRLAEVRSASVSIISVEKLMSWMRNVRLLKKRGRKSKSQDARNALIARVSEELLT